jgi:probable F420-dependent oxidoreductase
MTATERRVRFGMVNEVIPAGRDGWLDNVRRAEDCGVDTFLIRDHLAPGPFGPQLAPLATATAVAAHSTRLRVGTMVLSNDYRHPALLAHEAATIDWLSDGRLELGLGAGWLRGEYHQMGIAFDPAGTRIARLEEAVGVITGLLAGQTVTFRGTHYDIDSLTLPVAAAQRPRPPLMIGGGGPKMLALAGRHADIAGVLPAPIRGDEDSDDPADRAPAALQAKLAVLREAAGERFSRLEISTFATFRVTGQRRRDTEDLIRQRGWQGIGCEQVWAMPTVFIGSADQIWQDLHDRRRRYGVSYYVTSDRNLDQVAQVIGHAAAG